MKVKDLFENMASAVHGRYTSARDINAKEAKKTRCASCNAPISKDNAYNVAGEMVCKKCKSNP